MAKKCTLKRAIYRRKNRGCPCKGRNVLCGSSCKCGTMDKPCRNRVCIRSKITRIYYQFDSVINFLRLSNFRVRSITHQDLVREEQDQLESMVFVFQMPLMFQRRNFKKTVMLRYYILTFILQSLICTLRKLCCCKSEYFCTIYATLSLTWPVGSNLT